MGSDYNIYIHTIGSNGQDRSPTTPWQVAMSDEGSGDVVSGGDFNPSSAVRKGASFLSNPDSAIGSILKTPIGKIGAVGIAIMAAIHLTDKAITMYQAYAAPASGDYKFQIEYNNFKQSIHNTFHPFSTEIQRQYNTLQIKKENLANEQARLLLGGTYINSPYGRYL